MQIPDGIVARWDVLSGQLLEKVCPKRILFLLVSVLEETKTCSDTCKSSKKHTQTNIAQTQKWENPLNAGVVNKGRGKKSSRAITRAQMHPQNP